MTIAQMRESLRDISAELDSSRIRAQALAANPAATVDEMAKATSEITQLRARAEILQNEIADAESRGASVAKPAIVSEPRGLKDILRSREYMRAFTAALRRGDTPRRTEANDRNRILYDALTIAGGSPAGEDGGYLVPEDMDLAIREQLRASEPLSELVTNEIVSTNTGWRVTDTSPTTGFTALTSEVPSGGVPSDDQPSFGKVPYSLTTYGLRLPISNELLDDESAGLIPYLSRWYAKKLALTHNELVLGKLNALTASNIAPSTADSAIIGAIKQLLNVSLDPAISATANIITNQDGFNYLDQLTDDKGRPLLQPDPTSGTPMLFHSRPVKMLSNAQLATREVTTTGETKGVYYPLYVGDGRQYMTLFQRAPMELASTDIGGDAWKSYSTEMRGIVRLGASVFDSAAMVKREIFIAATAG